MFFRSRNGAAIAALCLCLFAVLGCGPKGPTMVPVSGNVTLDEKPLAEGTIYFKTVQTGASDPLPIKQGKYEGKVSEGERRVEITAYRTKVVGTDKMKGEVQEALISSKFNSESKLTAKVVSDGKNTFDFAVTGR